MKKALMILVGTILATSSSFSAPDEPAGATRPMIDLVAMGNFYVPSDDDNYDYGGGVEIQGRFWINSYLGIALAGGSTTWTLDERDTFSMDGPTRTYNSIEGYVNMAPLGASLLLRPIKRDRVAMTLEAGIRYVAVDSQAELEVQVDGPDRFIYLDDTLDIEDGVVGVVAATLEVKMQEQIYFIGGVGYQYDIEKGDVTYLEDADYVEIDLGENEMEAFYVQAGLGIRF